ncbi:MAG: ABC-ATPase UvrA, partial [Pirellulales bacterium]
MTLATEKAASQGADGNDGTQTICIRGARVHNLQNIDLDIPRDRLVVITGPSGSGKSSLAFDTLFAEGQRQYIEILSAYARQFLHQMERPDVDLIDGLQPTLSIDQRAGSQNPRSTVATMTEVYDHLRLLFARLGDAACYQCGAAIRQQTPEQIIEELLDLPEGTRLLVMAPLVRGRKGQHKDVLAAVRKAGFVRVRVDGEVLDLDQVGELAPRKNHRIDAVVDRIVVRSGVDARLAESTRLALSHGEGSVLVTYLEPSADGQRANGKDAWTEQLYSTLYACPHCKISFEELEPRTFSFNSPYGACPTCEGLGSRVQFDPELVLSDDSLSLADGAVVAWKGATDAALRKVKSHLRPWMQSAGFDWKTPINQLKPKTREQLLPGDGHDFLGVLTLLEQQYVTSLKPAERARLEALRGVVTCPDCGGARLRAEARACRFHGKAIHEITALTVSQARDWFAALKLPKKDEPVARPILREIDGRLEFLDNVGVEYLSLDRPADTLSGGEMQ